MFCREPEMGVVGPFVKVAKEAAPAVGPQDHVPDAKDTPTSKNTGEWNRFAYRDKTSRGANAPTPAESRQLQVQAAAQRMEGRAGLEGPARWKRTNDVGVVDHGDPQLEA
jgi:hypothetical protein